MEKLKCIGCGAEIQTENELAPGYVAKSVLAKDPSEIICKRCFRIKHYNQVMPLEIKEDVFLKMLSKIEGEDALVIKIIDIFDFTGSFIDGLNRHVGENDVILVGNKFDLLPKSVKPNKVTHWMKYMAAKKGLKAKEACVISSEKGHGFEELFQIINHYNKDHKKNIYVVGCTNVGKSTFINQVIKKYFDQDKDVITTSKFAGTTLNFIEIPLTDKSFLIDTPGVFNKHQYCHYVGNETLDLIMPKKEIKPMVFQLNPEQTLFAGGLARIDFISGEKTTFVTHFANTLPIHRTKLEKADEIETRIGEFLTPPTKEEAERLKDTRTYEYKVEGEKTDIVISGLGFVTLTGPAVVRVKVFKEIGVFVRKAII